MNLTTALTPDKKVRIGIFDYVDMKWAVICKGETDENCVAMFRNAEDAKDYVAKACGDSNKYEAREVIVMTYATTGKGT